MPVLTDHLADEIKELRESQQQMAEAIRDLSRDFGNFRVDVVDRLGTFSTSIRSEMAEKFGAINANLDASRERTDAALSGLRTEMSERFGAVNATLDASREQTDAALSGLRTEMKASREQTDAALSGLRTEMKASREQTDAALNGLRADLGASRERTDRSLTEIRVEVAEKFGAINTNLESFRGRVEISLRIASWTVGILIPLIFSVIGFGFWFTWHAAKLDSAVETLGVSSTSGSPLTQRALARQFAEPLDQLDCLFGRQAGGIDLAELDEERIGQRGEQAAGEGAAGLDLAADRSFRVGRRQAGVGAVLFFQEREDLAGALQHRGRHARQAGDMDTIALVGATGHDLVEEDDLALALAHRDVGVAKSRFGLLQLHQLVVVGGEQGPAADRVVDVLGDRPGQRDPVEGAGPSADLVEDHQAARGGVVEDVGRLGHLDHERALAAAQLVGGADPGEEPVDDPDPAPDGPGRNRRSGPARPAGRPGGYTCSCRPCSVR